MRAILFILVSFSLFNSCAVNNGQTNDEVEGLNNETIKFNPIVYVANPRETDTLCISEINRAKSVIKKEGVVFTQQVGFLYGHTRYDEELKELCKQKGIKHEIDLLGCVVFEGQTQGCYGAYMDKILAETYGAGFKENMHKSADSFFLKNAIENNIAVEYWDCDERPKLPSEKERNSDYLPTLNVQTDINIASGNHTFFDVGFIVENDSTISNFHIRNFVAGSSSNEKYEEELFNLVVDHLKSNYPVWIPGIIGKTQVRTDNNVRIYLAKE